MSGAAWQGTASLDLQEFKHPKGAERLLAHLWQELEPLVHLRIFSTLSEFYRSFRRTPGQEYITFGMDSPQEVGGNLGQD